MKDPVTLGLIGFALFSTGWCFGIVHAIRIHRRYCGGRRP